MHEVFQHAQIDIIVVNYLLNLSLDYGLLIAGLYPIHVSKGKTYELLPRSWDNYFDSTYRPQATLSSIGKKVFVYS